MNHHRKELNRRELLIRSSFLVAGAIIAGTPANLLAQELAALDVASAGSIRPMLEGPLKTSAAKTLKCNLRTHAQATDVVALSLVDGTLKADVFIPITAGPMLTVMRSGKAEVAQPIASTEMVIVYSPKSRFAAQFDATAKGKANWWEILQKPGLRFARSNPAGDPGGRNIIFTMMLAARKYKQANLVEKVLGPMLNPKQILTGGNNQARLQSGELDASGSYKIGPEWVNLPYITLPDDINLSGQNVHAEHPDVGLSIDGKTYYPEPLVYYAAVLKNAADPTGAAAFLKWLQDNEAQALFRRYQFAPPGNASVLHA
jgi:molybdate/tungstate transport system substrate-binding protein